MKRTLFLLLLVSCYPEPKTVNEASELDVHACLGMRYETMRCVDSVRDCARRAGNDLSNYNACVKTTLLWK